MTVMGGSVGAGGSGPGRWAGCLAALLALAPVHALSAQVLSGSVRDLERGAPIPQVRLAVLDSAGAIVLVRPADEDGTFRLPLPGPGRYRVVARAFGYQEARTPLVAVAVGDDREIHVGLPAAPVAVDPLEVRAPRPLAERGSPVHTGRMGPGELESLLPQTDLVSLLRRMSLPSLRVTEVYRRGSSRYLPCIQFVRGISPENHGCRMVTIVLNGRRVIDPADFLVSFDPSRLVEVEFLPPTVAGARWGTGSENGVLLLTEGER